MKIEAHGRVFELRSVLQGGEWFVMVYRLAHGVAAEEKVHTARSIGTCSSLTDALTRAGDWIAEEYPKTLEPAGHDFAWAVEQMAAGRAVRFRDWETGEHLNIGPDGEMCRLDHLNDRLAGIKWGEARSTDGWVLA